MDTVFLNFVAFYNETLELEVVESCIVLRSDGSQLFLDALFNGQFVDKLFDAFFVDVFVGACEAFQQLVSAFDLLAAKHGLDGFGHHSVVLLQVVADFVFVEQELVQAFHQRLEGNQCVSQRHTDVASDGRVGQVALQTADWQLTAEVVEDGVGHAEVAFCVFKVNRVHLVRHR